MLKTDGYTIVPVMPSRPVMQGKGRRKQRGKGFFGDIGNFLGTAGGGLVGGLVGAPAIGAGLGGIVGRKAGDLLGGRRRRKQKGQGIKDMLKKAHDFVKEKKLISKGIDMAGYGKRKRRK
jgi:uncharacterized membrane protein